MQTSNNYKLISILFSFIYGLHAVAEPDPALVSKYFEHISAEQKTDRIAFFPTEIISINLSDDYDGQNGVTLVDSLLEAIKNFPKIRLGVYFGSDLGENKLPVIKKLRHASIISINLTSANLEDDGALTAANELEHPNIEVLNLSSNKISNEGALALANALNTNQTLLKLRLDGNGIGKLGINALSRALLNNSSLIELDLGRQIPFDGTREDERDIFALRAQLEINKKLYYDIIKNNQLFPDGWLLILATKVPINEFSILTNDVLLKIFDIIKMLRIKELKHYVDQKDTTRNDEATSL